MHVSISSKSNILQKMNYSDNTMKCYQCTNKAIYKCLSCDNVMCGRHAYDCNIPNNISIYNDIYCVSCVDLSEYDKPIDECDKSIDECDQCCVIL